MEKICLFCVQLEYIGGGTGEYAEPSELTCNRSHNLANGQHIYTLEDFRRMIKTAEICTDYEQVKP